MDDDADEDTCHTRTVNKEYIEDLTALRCGWVFFAFFLNNLKEIIKNYE